MSNNETKTVNIVRKKLEKVGFNEERGFIVDEQISASGQVGKLLVGASKKVGGQGRGKPEFIILKNGVLDYVLIFECKADPKNHKSTTDSIDRFQKYAVDGVLLYASYLAKEFNVIAVAVSGQTEKELKISTFFQPRGVAKANVLTSESGVEIQEIIGWEDYIRFASYDEDLAVARKTDLIRFSRDLHNYLRDYGKITEAQKPLLVSGVLIALMESGFKVAYSKYETSELAKKTFQAIKDIISKARLGVNQEAKKEAILNAFSFIEYHPELQKFDKKKNESPLVHIIRDIDSQVRPFTQNHYDYDVIGNFYGEFIRYTGGDKQGLGIVLTPKHITELFADLAKLNKNSVVLDTCCGTGGFLISAMKKMTVGVNEGERVKILESSLIGVEQEPQMFALAVSNMILRGDGKTNLYQGSCFDEEIFNQVKDKATAGFINPPYSQKGEDLHEWNFVITMLDALQKNATGIVIVPMSLAIAKHLLRWQLLKEHRLEAVMSMPDDLFYPVGVVACIMVFTAHVPHDSDKHHKSWFGYWKDDGFRKDRAEGRMATSEWKSIREGWIASYSNRKEIPGFCVSKKVSADDEWSAEAYLETNYSILKFNNFVQNIRKYVAYKILNFDNVVISGTALKKIIPLSIDENKWFLIEDLFTITGTKTTPKLKLQEIGEGNFPYVTTQSSNNGVEDFYSFYTEEGNVMVIDSAVAGFCSYQEQNFSASDHVEKLTPKFKLNKYIGLFLQTIINLEQFRYSYGKKFNQEKIRKTKIKLPADKNGNPDWQAMEGYIKSLPYSGSI